VAVGWRDVWIIIGASGTEQQTHSLCRKASIYLCSSIDLMDAGPNGFPSSFKCPWRASSFEISRNDIVPPLGRLRRSCRTKTTNSGFISA
jgi:hypothetical protein